MVKVISCTLKHYLITTIWCYIFSAMKARLMMAALDWNGQETKEVKGKDGKAVFDLIHVKRTKKWVPRKRYVTRKTHVGKIMTRTMQVKQEGITLPPIVKPAGHQSIASTPKPEVTDMSICSRFKK